MDDDVTHVEGEIDPVRDLDIIAEELRLKDEDTLNKNLEKLERTVVRGNDKKLKPEYVSVKKIKIGFIEKSLTPLRLNYKAAMSRWDIRDDQVVPLGLSTPNRNEI